MYEQGDDPNDEYIDDLTMFGNNGTYPGWGSSNETQSADASSEKDQANAGSEENIGVSVLSVIILSTCFALLGFTLLRFWWLSKPTRDFSEVETNPMRQEAHEAREDHQGERDEEDEDEAFVLVTRGRNGSRDGLDSGMNV